MLTVKKTHVQLITKICPMVNSSKPILPLNKIELTKDDLPQVFRMTLTSNNKVKRISRKDQLLNDRIFKVFSIKQNDLFNTPLLLILFFLGNIISIFLHKFPIFEKIFEVSTKISWLYFFRIEQTISYQALKDTYHNIKIYFLNLEMPSLKNKYRKGKGQKQAQERFQFQPGMRVQDIKTQDINRGQGDRFQAQKDLREQSEGMRDTFNRPIVD